MSEQINKNKIFFSLHTVKIRTKKVHHVIFKYDASIPKTEEVINQIYKALNCPI
jgi:hypothetical protein